MELPAGGHRADPPVLRFRQAGSHSLRPVALECRCISISAIRTSIRIRSGTSSSRGFPISLTLGLTGFLLSYLVCVPLGVLQGREARQHDSISSAACWSSWATRSRAGRSGTALLVLFGGGSFWSVFPLGGFRSDNWEYLIVLAEDRRPGRAHVPAGALLHGRRIRDADDPDEELADGEHVAGLRADGVREGASQAARDLRACAAQFADSDCHRAWATSSA